MAAKAKEFRYAIGLDRTGRVTADGQSPLELDAAWTPEHLVLAALLRCSVASLRHHALRAQIEVTRATGNAAALFTRRESDGRFAMTKVELALDVELEPELGQDELGHLLQKAERDCFIGASLAVKPTYRWGTA